MTLDELYDEWRNQILSEEEIRQSSLAIAASLRDLDRGILGRSASEVIAGIRAKYGIEE